MGETVASTYTPLVAAVFLLNVFLGTGVLTLPYAFVRAGIVLSFFVLLGFGCIAYVTAMFLLEAMAAANALSKRAAEDGAPALLEANDGGAAVHDGADAADGDASSAIKYGSDGVVGEEGGDDASGDGSSDEYFNLRQRFEVGELAAKLSLAQGDSPRETIRRRLEELGVYVFLVAYTFGCLSTYAVAVVTTLDQLIPWHPAGVDTYHLWLVVFACVVFPFCFGDFQNTRVLQIVVIIVRFAAYGVMVVTSLVFIAQNAPYGRPNDDAASTMSNAALSLELLQNATNTTAPTPVPAPAVAAPGMWDRPREFYLAPAGLSSLLGNTIFTFMFHHSVPGLTTPIRPDKWIQTTLLLTIFGSVLCYLLLCGAAMFAFEDSIATSCATGAKACLVQKLYSLNFQSYHFTWIGKFIQGYPLLMVCLYPLIAITLRNNLRRLIALVCTAALGDGSPWTRAFRGTKSIDAKCATANEGTAAQLLLSSVSDDVAVIAAGPSTTGLLARLWAKRVEASVVLVSTLLAALPPLVLAAIVRDVQQVAHYTGSFAGLFVMLIIPSLLVLNARRRVAADEVLREMRNPLALGRLSCGQVLPIVMIVIAIIFFIFTVVEVVLKIVGAN